MEEQKASGDKIIIFSKKKWLWTGIIIALVNPIFAGLIIAAIFLSEPELKTAGKIVATVAIFWGAFLLYLISQNFSSGLFGA